MPFLVIVGGPDRGRHFEITEGQTLVIGRSQTSDTQINDPRVSRVHCRVVIDGGTVTLLDNDSAGGTFVGGAQVSRQELNTGDTFAVGDTTIRYQLDSNLPDEQATVAPVAQAEALPQKTPQLMDLVGQTLAHYRLDKIIAKGNTGMIFKAQDLESDRVAAVKVLTPDPNHSDEQRDRFVRAMKTMLPIKHDHLISLYHAGKTGPFCWAAMQYIEGESLTELISRMGIEGMLDWRETWRIGVQIGRALDAAYEQKIIHRNVTPTNILRRNSDSLNKSHSPDNWLVKYPTWHRNEHETAIPLTRVQTSMVWEPPCMPSWQDGHPSTVHRYRTWCAWFVKMIRHHQNNTSFRLTTNFKMR